MKFFHSAIRSRLEMVQVTGVRNGLGRTECGFNGAGQPNVLGLVVVGGQNVQANAAAASY